METNENTKSFSEINHPENTFKFEILGYITTIEV